MKVLTFPARGTVVPEPMTRVGELAVHLAATAAALREHPDVRVREAWVEVTRAIDVAVALEMRARRGEP